MKLLKNIDTNDPWTWFWASVGMATLCVLVGPFAPLIGVVLGVWTAACLSAALFKANC